MTSAETLLRKAAADGSLPSAEWPKTLHYLLQRLDQIVAEFPAPPTDPSASAIADLPSRPQTSHAIFSQESHFTDKENASPTTPPGPPVPTFPGQDMPQDMATLWASIRTTLANNFGKDPPHTVQRLAELVLEPKKRYRYLPSYLRALDRVISVSSPLTIFPLPQAVLPTAGGLLNGSTSNNPATSALGSDESLGGALLTPIPWLQNRGQSELISESTEMVDGPNGAGRIETVTVGMLTSTSSRPDTMSSNPIAQIASSHPDGETLPSTGPVTQGELLRQEQEAGIVLNNPHNLNTSPTRSSFIDIPSTASIIETVEADEEVPHARGPDEIGMEDTGPQKESKGLDIEGAIGRPSVGEKTTQDPETEAEAQTGGDTKTWETGKGQEEGTDEEMRDAAAKTDSKQDVSSSEKQDADIDMKDGERL